MLVNRFDPRNGVHIMIVQGVPNQVLINGFAFEPTHYEIRDSLQTRTTFEMVVYPKDMDFEDDHMVVDGCPLPALKADVRRHYGQAECHLTLPVASLKVRYPGSVLTYVKG